MDIQTVAPNSSELGTENSVLLLLRKEAFRMSLQPVITPIHSHLGWPLPLGPCEGVANAPLCQCRGNKKLSSLADFKIPEVYVNTPEAGVLGGSEEEMEFKRFQGRQLAWRLQGPMLSKEICFPKPKSCSMSSL